LPEFGLHLPGHVYLQLSSVAHFLPLTQVDLCL
jgi:hypothetical protein